MFLKLTFALLVFNGVAVDSEGQPVVVTPLGALSGYYMATREGRQISAFTSVPYAVPPVGELRFKAPVPVKPWANTLDATKVVPACVQRNPYIRQIDIVGQEDCLYLNIYSPTEINDVQPVKRLLPVMVFIHGGGWMCGDSSTEMYGPEFLLDRDIVLVTINYRLGPLGFLSTQDELCPGNNGLKDQQEALRFIQNYIEHFGGDKNSVTIFGESAGGASVHFHMLSRSSEGLFHKAISESGTALVPWAEAPPGEALKNAYKLAKFLNCPQAPSDRMLDCLRSKDSYDIINTEFRFYSWDYEPMTPFKAVVEPDYPGAFLTRNPRKVPETSSVPWMTGLNKDEGCLKSVWITANESRFQEFISGFDLIAPVTFYYDNSPYADLITRKIRNHYLNGDVSAVHRGILEMYSDSYFSFPGLEAVQLTLNYTRKPIYLYELAYRATNSFSQIFGDPEGNYGVCHADELMHLFPIHFLTKEFSRKDIEISKLFVTLWTNFATTGNPNKPNEIPFEWTPTMSRDSLEYLELRDESEMKEDWASKAKYWSKLPLWHNFGANKINDEL